MCHMKDVNLEKPIDQYPRTFTVPLVVPVIMSIIGPYLVMVPFIKVRLKFSWTIFILGGPEIALLRLKIRCQFL